MTRLSRTGHWRQPQTKHPHSHTVILDEVRRKIPELQFPQDKSWFKVKTANNFAIKIADRREFQDNKIRPMPWDPGILNVFTDGSKTDSGTGAAYMMKSHELREQDYIHLGEHATVFQAEITAINMATLTILDAGTTDHTINYHIDSQGAIKSLYKYETRNKCVAECKRLLNKLSETNTVTLNWIPGHSGQLGNGVADNLAKLGAEYPDEGLEPRLPVSDSVITGFIKNWAKDEHNEKWTNSTEYRQTKLILPDTQHRWAKQACKLERNELRILTQIVTGHANLKRHLHIMGYVDDPNCECGEEPQTPIHILTRCTRLAGLRTAVLGRPEIKPENIRNYTPKKILKFAEKTGLWNFD